MNTVRVLLNEHLNALIEAQRGIDFQRMAHQCLCARWPSLASVPEQADLGEDGITILGEASEGIQRSLLCSLTATIEKLRSDTRKIAARNVRLDEVVFATPRRVTRAQQERWAKWVGSEYGWRLIVIERSEFLAILERPESQWICRDYLGLPLRHSVLLTSAEEAKEAGRLEDCLRLAAEAERVALEGEDRETLCRAQILQAEAFLELGNAAQYGERADQALRTARDANLRPHLPKCLLLRANAILPHDPREAHRLIAEAEASIDSNDRKSRRWSLLIRARLEEGEDRLDAARSTLSEWHALVKRGEKTNRQGFHYLSFRIAAKTGDPQALSFLARALKEAAAKKQWTFVGDMLREKALFLSRRGKLKEAAEQSIDASGSYRKAGNKEAELDAAILSGQMFLEVHLAERALELANYAIERIESTTDKKIEENALQLKTRALQSLGRIDEAMAVNNRFRALVTLQPIALVVADAQEAMLYFQKGELGSAAANMEKALYRARETGAQEEIVAAIRIHLAEIRITQTRFREARQLLEDAIP